MNRCPVCGKEYSGHPALSRKDNATYICPECGQREALESIGVIDREEQDHIIGLGRGYTDEEDTARCDVPKKTV